MVCRARQIAANRLRAEPSRARRAVPCRGADLLPVRCRRADNGARRRESKCVWADGSKTLIKIEVTGR